MKAGEIRNHAGTQRGGGSNVKSKMLTVKEAKEVYDTFLVNDFPRSERKPFFAIENSLKKGQYICCAAVDKEDHTLGYAFFVMNDSREYLLDYFAVRKDLRGNGIGSSFIKTLSGEVLQGASCVLVEIDNPEYGSGEVKELYERRRQFYLRNGFVDTCVDVNTFGVEFRIMELPGEKAHSMTEVKSVYAKLYRSCLPELVYKTMVRIG